MKKVVLLAGVLAAGMAAAPVAANAAPTLPDLQKVQDLTPDQTHTMKHGEIDVTAHNLGAEYNEIVKQIADPSYEGKYKGYDADALASMKTALENGPIKDLDDANTALEAAYTAWNASAKTAADEAAFNAAVGAISYPSQDDVDGVLEAMASFDADVKAWKAYDLWLNGATPADDVNETGVSDLHLKLTTGTNYQGVNELADVATAEGNYNTAKTAFTTALGAMPVAGLDGVSSNKVVANQTAIEAAKAALSNGTNGAYDVLDKLVADYQAAKAKYLGTDEGMYGAIEASMSAKMADPKNDLTAGEFLLDSTDPTSYSHKYATALGLKLFEFAAAVEAAEKFIKSFAADDAANWEATLTGEGLGSSLYDGIASLAEYNTKAAALLQKLVDLEGEYDDIIEAAKKNVEAAKQLVVAEGTRQSEMDGAFLDATKTTKANGTTPVSYRDRNTEEVSFTGLASTVKDGTPYIYRSYIDALQAKLNDANTDYDGTDAVDTDIHDQILKYFDDPASADNDHDAVAYKATMTDAEGVLLGEIKGEIETLASAIEANESANVALHALEAALDKHVLDMVATCRDYDDVTSADLTYGGKYYTDGTCEDNRNYHGVETLRKTDIGNFKQEEVTAYNSFDPANATQGAAAFLGDDTNSPAKVKRYAIDDEIELLWNHIATDQLNKYLKDVEDKMVAKFNDAKALDKVCRGAADVWDWTVVPDTDEECKCEPNDTKMNPCGWCNPTVKAALNAIRQEYNDNSEAKETAHAGTGSTDVVDYVDAATEYPGVGTAKSLVADFKTYAEDATKAGGDIETWYLAFEKADKDHDDKLQDKYNEAHDRIHEFIHEVAGQVSFDIVNFEKGDTAAADLWAKDLKNRTFEVYNGEGAEKLVLGVDFNLDGTTDEFATFQEFYEAIKAADAKYNAEAQKLLDEHKWTELEKLSEKVLGVKGVNDYMKAVDTNRTATIVLREQLATAQAELNTVVDGIDKLRVYSDISNMGGDKDDYKTLTTTALATAQAVLNAEADAIKAANEAGTAKDYTYKEAVVKGAIATYTAAVKYAEDLFAANKDAYEALEAALAEFDAVAQIAEKAAKEAKIAGAIYNVEIDGDNNDASDVDAKMALIRIDTAADAITIDGEHDHYLAGFKAATLAGAKATELGHLKDLQTKLDAAEEALLAATAYKAKNVENYGKLYAELQAAEENLATLNTEFAALGEDGVYNVEGRKDLDTIKDLVQKARDLDDTAKAGNVPTALGTALAEGKVYTVEQVAALSAEVAKITAAVEEARAEIAKDVKFKHDNVEAYDRLYAQLAAVNETRVALDTEWEAAKDHVYEVVGHMDQTEVEDAINALAKVSDLRTELNEELAAATVLTNEGDLSDEISALTNGIAGVRALIAEKVKFFEAEQAAAADYRQQIADLEDRYEALGTVWNAYENLEDSDLDIKALNEGLKAISEDIMAERGNITDDLAAAKVQANHEKHEKAIQDIETAIKDLQDKVRQCEEYKSTNEKNFVTLRDAANNLLASIEDVKYVNDDVYAELPATEPTNDLDAESIEAAREDAVKLVNDELTALATALEEGKLYTDAEVAAQQAKLDEISAALQDLKDQVKAAEDFHRANAELKDKLEERVQTILALINTAYANSECDKCNAEDTADLDAEREATYEVLGYAADSYAVGHLAMPTATDNYTKYNEDLDGVEADVKATLEEIAEHKIMQKQDQQCYDKFMNDVLDLDAQLAVALAQPGAQWFEVRTDHCSNPDVLYFNELKDNLQHIQDILAAQHAHETVTVDGVDYAPHSVWTYLKENALMLNDFKQSLEKTVKAIEANEAAYNKLYATYEEVNAAAEKAANDIDENYLPETKDDVLELLVTLGGNIQDTLDEINDVHEHGNAAYKYTVDAAGKEYIESVNESIEKAYAAIDHLRNEAANEEAYNHIDHLVYELNGYINEYLTSVEYAEDPFIIEVREQLAAELNKLAELDADGNIVEGSELGNILADIQLAYGEKVSEYALNIINQRAGEVGIHQRLDELQKAIKELVETYAQYYEDAHHLSNGKTVYSDQEYFTLGFFRNADLGRLLYGEDSDKTAIWTQPDEMFQEVQVNNQNGENVMLAQVINGGMKTYAVKTEVLVNGAKKNEIGFEPKHISTLAVETLAAGDAVALFKAGSLSVKDAARTNGNWWTCAANEKHEVTIAFKVAEPVITSGAPVEVQASNSKLIVRVNNPVDLTYTVEDLVATTETGSFTFADAIFNESKGQIEFDLPEGTQNVEIPEGFFTFRTGENTISRSAALSVAVVGGSTSIEALIAMGEKAQIFDLQGRRVKAEALISGNTYVVNGEKTMVK